MTKPEAESTTKRDRPEFPQFQTALRRLGLREREHPASLAFANGPIELEHNYRALEVNHLDNPSRLIKQENAFKSADELKLKRTETIAFSSE